MLLVLFASLIILGALTVVVERLHAAKRGSDIAVNQLMLDESLKGAIDTAVSQVWHSYLVAQDVDSPAELADMGADTMTAYRDFIDGLVDDGDSASILGPEKTYIGPGRITDLSIAREDSLGGTELRIRATGVIENLEQTAEQSVLVSGQAFQGADFAVLTNNVSCVFCHAEVRPLELLNAPPDENVLRVRVGALDNILLRLNPPNAAFTNIAGTVYTRGQVRNPDGSPIPPDQIPSSTFKSYEFEDNSDVLLRENGDLIPAGFQPAVPDSQGDFSQFENMYLDYPTDPDGMVDGPVPAEFPSPFTDLNGNRRVDKPEYDLVADFAEGQLFGGTIVGDAGGGYTNPDLPKSGTVGTVNGTYTGNLIMIGTEGNPITFRNEENPGAPAIITVDGDVVMKGKVKGTGQLFAKGNVYVIGDLTYDDAPGEFGQAVDGTNNALAITPGGNILIGDFTTRSALNNDSTDAFGQGEFIDTRLEHEDTFVRDPEDFDGDGEPWYTKDTGYFGPLANDPADAPEPGGKIDPREDWTGFASSEMMLFNQTELDLAKTDSTHTPRYYKIREDAPVWVYESVGGAEQHTNHYNDPLARQLSEAELLDAAVLQLTPTNDWITEEQLRRWWHDDELSRPDSGRPFQVDAFLYSNNGIFGMAKSKRTHNSNTYGQMLIRGALIAPDLGLLAPSNAGDSTGETGLAMFRDSRISEFVKLIDTSKVSFSRKIFRKV